MKLNGAQLIMRMLERQGIEIIPGIPGGANLPLYDAFARSSIRHILARHEQGAGFMAQGMARSTGKTAVCFGTSGPGATNLVTAIADAHLDSVPLVVITGQVPLPMIGTDAFQEIDMYGLTIPITKHNYLVRSAAELLEIIPEAFRIAASGRPGPVVVDVPKDVQLQTLDVDRLPEPGRADPPPALAESDIRRMTDLIRASERPVLYIGGGALSTEAATQVQAFMEAQDAPAACSLMGLGAIPTGHPLYLGMVGMHGAPFTNLFVNECDLLIAVGTRFGDRATGRIAEFCPDAQVIHIDIDPSEHGKLRMPACAITASAADAMAALNRAVAPRQRPDWRARLAELKARHPLETPGCDDPARPYGIIALTAAMLDEPPIVCTDVGQHQMWTAQTYPLSHPRQFLTSGGLGTMGFGLPAALGASLANPERTVVCFSGDGSIMMNIQELATAAETGANVKVIVMNNGALGLVRQQQQLFYGGRYFASQFSRRPDLVAIARGFGVTAYDLAQSQDPVETLARALSQSGPCLINAPVPQSDNVYPMVPPGAGNTKMIRGDKHATVTH
jgi:acetolactate synthase-1/2/3 large subunit